MTLISQRAATGEHYYACDENLVFSSKKKWALSLHVKS
jgi:hypothetical protein